METGMTGGIKPILRGAATALVVVVIFLGAIAALLLGFVWWTLPAATAPVTIPSPDGRAAVKKQYGPFDEAGYVDISVVSPGLFFDNSHRLATLQNPTGVTNEDGATISWSGSHHVTVGWPVNGMPVQGPSNVDGIQISYRAYDPDLSHVSEQNVVSLPLHHVAVTFREAHVQDPHARYVASGRPVEHIQCIVRVSGFDGSVFDNVTAELGGTAVGSGIGLEVGVTPLPRGKSPQQTLTQAELADVFPQNDLTSAPGQEGGEVRYRLFTVNEAQQVFSAVKRGRFDLLVALNFGEKVIRYKVETSVSSQVINSFNACSAKTSFYGIPFVVRQG
jgi:hypothetical protein